MQTNFKASELFGWRRKPAKWNLSYSGDYLIIRIGAMKTKLNANIVSYVLKKKVKISS